MRTTKNALQSALAITVALLLLVPGVIFFTDNANASSKSGSWVMTVQNTSAQAGNTEHVILVNGSWNSSIMGYSIAMRYDPTIIEIVDVSLEGTAAEIEVSPGYYRYWNLGWSSHEGDQSYLVAGAINLAGDPDLIVPAGSDILFKLIVNVKTTATNGDTSLNLDQNVGPSFSKSIFTDRYANPVYPELVDGVLTISGGGDNNAPYRPSNPNPANHATNVDIDALLSWTGGDPDGDSVTYEIYFGKTTSPPRVALDYSAASYNPGTMSYETTFYWKVIARDDKGLTNEGPIWSFTTESETTPSEGQLVISAPSSVTEEENFQVTVRSGGNAIENVRITFAEDVEYTNENGVVNLIAPTVSEDTSYKITANKTGYLENSKWINVQNQEDTLPIINLNSPNGGEIWEKNQLIEWTITPQEAFLDYAVSIYYRLGAGVWNTITEGILDLSGSYQWDTRSVPDGKSYWVQVVLKRDENQDGKFETIVSKDTSDKSFTIDNIITGIGWIHGTVTETIENGLTPIEDAVVCVIISTQDNVISSKCTFTDVDGKYTIAVPFGTYKIKAWKEEYITSIIDEITVWANQTTIVNFSLEKGIENESGFFPILVDENRKDINNAIEKGYVGGELIIQPGEDISYDSFVISYDAISINVTNITDNLISLVINGDEITAGRTIVITADILTFDQEIMIEYDGEPINMADNISDVLDPNNEGSHPEYIVTRGAKGIQLLVSIPHFSEHEISIYTIEEVVEALGGMTAIIYYIVICALTAIIFIGTVYLRKRM